MTGQDETGRGDDDDRLVSVRCLPIVALYSAFSRCENVYVGS